MRVVVPFIISAAILCFSIFLLVSIFIHLYKWSLYQDAREAQVESVQENKLEVKAGRSTLRLQYSYEIDGVIYQSDRLSIYSGARDDFDRFRRRMHNSLKKAESVSCYYIEGEYDNAALSRDYRWQTLLPNLLGFVVSLAIGCYGMYCAKYELEMARQRNKVSK